MKKKVPDVKINAVKVFEQTCWFYHRYFYVKSKAWDVITGCEANQCISMCIEDIIGYAAT